MNKTLVSRALQEAGSVSGAAKLLNVSRGRLQWWLLANGYEAVKTLTIRKRVEKKGDRNANELK